MPISFNKVISTRALSDAWDKLNKENKNSYGISGETIGLFTENLKVNIVQISEKLISEKYDFSAYRPVLIPKDNGKKRPLQIPEIKDRIVLKSLAIALEGLFSSTLNKSKGYSFAYQKGIGIEDAIKKIEEYYNNGYHWILEADIINFFGNVNKKNLLENVIYPKIKDERLIKLIESASRPTIDTALLNELNTVDQKYFNGIEDGIPQGNPLSPLFSNIYLSSFDRFMIRKGYKLIRYADDFIVMFKSKQEAQECYVVVSNFLKNELGLEIYELDKEIDGKIKTKIINPKKDSFSFLSITFDGKNFYPSRGNVDRFKLRIKKICLSNYSGKNVSVVLRKVTNAIDGWFSSYSFIKAEIYSEEIDVHINKFVLLGMSKLNWRFSTNSRSIVPAKFIIPNESNECLSYKQRKNSGIPFAEDILKERRESKKL